MFKKLIWNIAFLFIALMPNVFAALDSTTYAKMLVHNPLDNNNITGNNATNSSIGLGTQVATPRFVSTTDFIGNGIACFDNADDDAVNYAGSSSGNAVNFTMGGLFNNSADTLIEVMMARDAAGNNVGD